MTGNERLALINVKVGRAKKHLVDLKKEVSAFLKTNPYKIGTKRDPERKLIYYVAGMQPMPNDFAAATGDIIQNLRSSLDHLAYQLFLVGTNDAGENESGIYFPFIDPTKQGMPSFESKVKGMRQDAKDALLNVEAYKGGKGHTLWQLNKLNNIDKHRLLITVGSGYHSADLGGYVTSMLQKVSAFPIPTVSAFFRPANNMCPLKEGDELLIDAIDAEPNDKIGFQFNIALNEPGVLEGEPLIETLQSFTDVTSRIIVDFKPYLE